MFNIEDLFLLHAEITAMRVGPGQGLKNPVCQGTPSVTDF